MKKVFFVPEQMTTTTTITQITQIVKKNQNNISTVENLKKGQQCCNLINK